VKRLVTELSGAKSSADEKFTIHSVHFFRDTSDIIIDAVEAGSVRVNVPGSPESMVALNTRASAESLSEVLRHLEADQTYALTLRRLRQVDYYLVLYRLVFCSGKLLKQRRYVKGH